MKTVQWQREAFRVECDEGATIRVLLFYGSEKLVEVDGKAHGFFEALSRAEHLGDKLEILLHAVETALLGVIV